jgi:hypothetical protein
MVSLRWLSSMVGGRARVGIRRRAAPLARRDLAAEIDAHALPIVRARIREIALDPDQSGQAQRAVVVQIDASARPAVAAWLEAPPPPRAPGHTDAEPTVRTDWLFLPHGPEAILIGVVEGAAEALEPLRFNVRFAADPYRRHLKALTRTGLLGLSTMPLKLGPERQLASPCTFVPIQNGPLRDFLRELPPVPVV